jgi:hypothetical protein
MAIDARAPPPQLGWSAHDSVWSLTAKSFSSSYSDEAGMLPSCPATVPSGPDGEIA